MAARPRGQKQRKLNENVYSALFLCPLSITFKLNFNIISTLFYFKSKNSGIAIDVVDRDSAQSFVFGSQISWGE